MRLVAFEDSRKPSKLVCISTEDLLYGIDAFLSRYGDSSGPYQRSVCSEEARHLVTDSFPVSQNFKPGAGGLQR